MKTIAIAALVLPVLAGPVTAARAQTPPARLLQLSFDSAGAVTLMASNVTVRDILAEWARKCGCYVVNADRLTGAPLAVPIAFERESQARVLASLLRQAAGYVLTPRRAGSTSASAYETIFIVASSSPSAAPAAYSSYGSTTTAVAISTAGSPDDEIPPVLPAGAARPAATAPPPPDQNRPSTPGVLAQPIVAIPAPQQTQSPPAPGRAGTPTPAPPPAGGR